jgi:ribosomal protein S12 methylthiotransferase accessory factor
MELLDKHSVPLNFRDVISLETTHFDSDIETLRQQLQQRGYTSAVAIDLTKPQFGIPVVRVIIPGLKDE